MPQPAGGAPAATREIPSPLGRITLAASEAGILGLWFEGQRHAASTLPAGAVAWEGPDSGMISDAAARLLQAGAAWVERYFGGGNPGPVPPLDLRGTPFRQRVWEQLRSIPAGQTRTYGDLAAALATPGKVSSARAVGGAVGHNPLSLMVPCHRVLGAGGALTGYAGGIDRKIWLLRHEGVDLAL